MGCGCAGSTPKQASGSQQIAATREQQGPPPGGPGEDGYYWNGPPRAENAEVAEPAPAK